MLAEFGWNTANSESQYRVGETRQRADIALLKDERAVAVVNVLKFGDSLDNADAIKNLNEDAVGCNVHLAILTNGSVYRFYHVDTQTKEMEKYLEFKITRIELKNKNAALVKFFTFESFNAFALYRAYVGNGDM